MNFGNHLAVLFVVVACFVASTNSEFRIINGTSADIKDSPYMVSFHYNGKYYCAGSLITLQIVITAAHCLQPYTQKFITVVAGRTDIRETGQSRNVHAIFVPRSFRLSTRDMDIGAIKVLKPFIPGPKVGTIQLCKTKLKPGMQMQIFGWGATDLNIMKPVNVLQTSSVPIAKTKDCAALYKPRGTLLTNTMICAGCGGSDACEGDSGAPGVVNGRLCAVVSLGIGCADPQFPGVYTDVNNAKVRRFITTSKNT
ncbi:seminase-like [Eurosta solidaginis]|uniref:seminase-like n=1 Tax=Eurosta solidaginis TaxID=178769 RepID=UPI0035315090